MFRRNFIQRLTLAGASGFATSRPASAGARRTVTFRVKGFSCVTCAIGLDTVLSQERGVIRSQSSYPDALTTIEFDPSLVAERTLRTHISRMGFIAEEKG